MLKALTLVCRNVLDWLRKTVFIGFILFLFWIFIKHLEMYCQINFRLVIEWTIKTLLLLFFLFFMKFIDIQQTRLSAYFEKAFGLYFSLCKLAKLLGWSDIVLKSRSLLAHAGGRNGIVLKHYINCSAGKLLFCCALGCGVYNKSPHIVA